MRLSANIAHGDLRNGNEKSQIETPSRADAAGVTPVRPLLRAQIGKLERYLCVQERRANSVVGSLEVVHRPRIANILCAKVPAVEQWSFRPQS